jgi:hypothetical protein
VVREKVRRTASTTETITVEMAAVRLIRFSPRGGGAVSVPLGFGAASP